MSLSWQQRFDTGRPTYIKVNQKKFADLEAGTSVLIPSPRDIAVEIERLDDEETLSLTQLRQRLAERHDADGTCPVMCGMNLRVVAELTYEALDAGVPKSETVPVWKVIEPTSALAKKLPGGVDRLVQLRQ
jgi:hypothetical protein